MSKVFFEDLGMPKPIVDLGVGSGTHAEQTAAAMIGLERFFSQKPPRAVLVVGDVNSTLAAAIVAAKMGLFSAHVEAGLRSRDWSMPEEVNRVVTDTIVDLLLTPSADADDNLRWIKEARRQADWVIFHFHDHEFGHSNLVSTNHQADLHEPSEFARAFAHEAIDAGVDIFVGHGSHTPLGLEFYKGKPIFHSVGNFIFENETVRMFPSTAYERFDLGNEATPMDFLDARTNNGKKGHVAHPQYWENIVVSCHYKGGKLHEVRIHPIEQGYGRPRGQRGRPVLAKGEVAARVLARIDALSKPYGVRVTNRDGTGIASLPQ